MATDLEIADVRQNVDEPRDSQDYTNTVISVLVDDLGVNGASAEIWRKKAASYAKLVNVSEAGSSHAFSDLQDNALKMAKEYEAKSTGSTVGRAKVKVIERA